MTIKSIHLSITGRVQGVWYRGWTNQQANALNLDGWVRNRTDGSVEAVFSGNQEGVDNMLILCYDGPPSARVDSIIIDTLSERPPAGFHLKPTG